MDIQEFKELCMQYTKNDITEWYYFKYIKHILYTNCTNWTKVADQKYKSKFSSCANIITFKNPEKQLFYDWDGGLAYLIINPEFKCGFYFDYYRDEFDPPYILDFDDKDGNRIKKSFNDISALCAVADDLTQNKYSNLFNELSTAAKTIKLEEWLEFYRNLQYKDQTYFYNGQPIYTNREWLI